MEENKKSKKLIFLLLFLVIVLIIVVALNIYVVFFRKNTTVPENTNYVSQEIINNSEISTNNAIIDENTQNITSSDIDVTNQNSILVDFTDGVDLEEVKNLMEIYALGIGRVDFEDSNNLESNTVLLMIAKSFFDSKTNKSSLEINTKYAATSENIHTFLSELTGRDYLSVDYIPSYTNYVKYEKTSKSYALGSDYANIKKEKYICSDVSITNEKDGLYTAKVNVNRIVDDERTNYEITFTFTVNKTFTYEKYCIKSLKAKNLSFYTDNTLHLVSE